MNTIIFVVILLFTAVGCFIGGIFFRKKRAESLISSAEIEAKRIIDVANETVATKKQQVILEGKDEIYKLKNVFEKEMSEQRRNLQIQERRLQQREENLDRKNEKIEKKEAELSTKEHAIDDKLEEAEIVKKSQFDMLEKISGFTVKQAKDYLLDSLQDELDHEKAVKIKAYEQNLKEISEEKAKEVMSIAIQKCATDHSSTMMISVVPLLNDEMKGRLIGREGRNIRAIETFTGVDLIIDDTPEAITLSCFNPVRRAIAKLAIERLMIDGRIHPARIEEMVEKAKIDIEKDIKETGQKAVIDSKVHNLHPELIKLIGKLKYRTSYGQNVLNHSLEVSQLCSALASELGLDPVLARRCGLLHDIGKALDYETEGSHVQLGVDVAKKYKENDLVIHSIHAHHGDVETKTAIAFLVQAADAISAARPGARRENVEDYIKRLQKLEEVVSSFQGVENCFAIQAGREVRVMIKPSVVDDEHMVPLARNICKKIESDLNYPGQVKIHLIRETRAVEYAK